MRDNNDIYNRLISLEKEVVRLQSELTDLTIKGSKPNNINSEEKIKIGVYVESKQKLFYKRKIVKISPGGHSIYIDTKDRIRKVEI